MISMNPKIYKVIFFTLALSALLALSGCKTTTPPEPSPLDGNDMQRFLSRGRNPQIFGVYIRQTADGVKAKQAGNIKGSKKALLEFSSSRKSPLPVVEVESKSGRNFELLIDTSSRKSWTTFDLAEEIGLVPAGQNPARYVAKHVQDDVPAFFCIAPHLEFNKMTMTEGLVYARADRDSLWPVSRDFRHDNIQMVMGCGMLKAFAFVRIDFKNRTLALSGADEYSPEEREVLASVPIKWNEGAIAIEAELDGSKELVYIDTGGTFQIVYPGRESQVINEIRIGDLLFEDVAVTSGEEQKIAHRDHPSLGAELLQEMIVTIDNVTQTLHFEKP